MYEMKCHLKNLEDCKELAEKLAFLSAQGDVITLTGDLGTGKTCFARFFIQYLTTQDTEITSPTFNLVQTYDGNTCTIWHFDLYRLERHEELLELGIEDALFEGISLIEWPKIAKNYLNKEKLDILFEHRHSENDRFLTLRGTGKWEKTLKQIL